MTKTTEILNLYKAGATAREIAERVQCDRQEIYRFLRDRKLKPNPDFPYRPKPEAQARAAYAAAQRRSGLTWREVGERIGGVSGTRAKQLATKGERLRNDKRNDDGRECQTVV